MNDEVKQHVMLTPNVQRILAALHHVMSEAQRRDRNVTQYDLVKTLFLADRSHLNEWGRPITYDNYAAMKHGPVPSLAYDLLKGNLKEMRDHSVAVLPWKSVRVTDSIRHYVPDGNENNLEEHLSPSDVEALDDALGTVLRLGFGQIRKLTHEDPAYEDAWREDGMRAAYAMKLGLFFDNPDFHLAEEIAEYSPYV